MVQAAVAWQDARLVLKRLMCRSFCACQTAQLCKMCITQASQGAPDCGAERLRAFPRRRRRRCAASSPRARDTTRRKRAYRPVRGFGGWWGTDRNWHRSTTGALRIPERCAPQSRGRASRNRHDKRAMIRRFADAAGGDARRVSARRPRR